MPSVPSHYVPSSLSKSQKRAAKRELRKSRKAYKKKKYYTRKKVKGYKSRKTSWESRVKKVYRIPDKTKLNISLLSRKSKCSKKALNKIYSGCSFAPCTNVSDLLRLRTISEVM